MPDLTDWLCRATHSTHSVEPEAVPNTTRGTRNAERGTRHAPNAVLLDHHEYLALFYGLAGLGVDGSDFAAAR
jgi:hypothetical protein